MVAADFWLNGTWRGSYPRPSPSPPSHPGAPGRRRRAPRRRPPGGAGGAVLDLVPQVDNAAAPRGTGFGGRPASGVHPVPKASASVVVGGGSRLSSRLPCRSWVRSSGCLPVACRRLLPRPGRRHAPASSIAQRPGRGIGDDRGAHRVVGEGVEADPGGVWLTESMVTVTAALILGLRRLARRMRAAERPGRRGRGRRPAAGEPDPPAPAPMSPRHRCTDLHGQVGRPGRPR